MRMRYARSIVLVAIVALALTLSGCGNSKKGGGYGYVLHTPPRAPSSGQVSIG